jgi:hypothetical protein
VHADALVGLDEAQALLVELAERQAARVEMVEDAESQLKAWMPVCARPRISAWMSCVPS